MKHLGVDAVYEGKIIRILFVPHDSEYTLADAHFTKQSATVTAYASDIGMPEVGASFVIQKRSRKIGSHLKVRRV